MQCINKSNIDKDRQNSWRPAKRKKRPTRGLESIMVTRQIDRSHFSGKDWYPKIDRRVRDHEKWPSSNITSIRPY